MKIAILSDLHLTDNPDSVKIKVLQWAISKAAEERCGCLCCLGDLTAQGSDWQSAEIIKYLENSGSDYCSTPGNAELRIFKDGRNSKKFDIPPQKNMPLAMIDTSLGEPAAGELDKLRSIPDNGGFLLATHNPVSNWSSSAAAAVEKAKLRRAVTSVIAGHSHHDETEIMRGLDPDKASGGPPAIVIMEHSADGNWLRRDIAMPGIDPAEWNDDERIEFRNNIGISSMREDIAALEFAVENHIRHLELRMDEPVCSDSLLQAVSHWKKSGGQILSLHLPELKIRDKERRLKKFADLALKIGCSRVTLHVPEVTASEFDSVKDILLARFAEDMQIVMKNNIITGIENLHTSPGADTFETRHYGCTIDECRFWIELLRKNFNTENIGFHLDIGHCRNNAPVSEKENLSDWYSKMGKLINGWHLHQVGNDRGRFVNHHPLDGFYGKLISLGGIFMAYRSGQLNNAPMFLEARTFDENVQTYKTLMKLF